MRYRIRYGCIHRYGNSGGGELLMSGIVFYKSAAIECYNREVRILYLAPSFGESIEGKKYKLNH